jgi:hypothetical protein
MHVLTKMPLKIKIGMFEQLSKSLKMDGIHIFLLDVACLTSIHSVYMAIWLQENVAK